MSILFLSTTDDVPTIAWAVPIIMCLNFKMLCFVLFFFLVNFIISRTLSFEKCLN